MIIKSIEVCHPILYASHGIDDIQTNRVLTPQKIMSFKIDHSPKWMDSGFRMYIWMYHTPRYFQNNKFCLKNSRNTPFHWWKSSCSPMISSSLLFGQSHATSHHPTVIPRWGGKWWQELGWRLGLWKIWGFEGSTCGKFSFFWTIPVLNFWIDT